MLLFNELRITPDNNCLIIDALVENNAFFDNVTIDSVWIDTQDTFENANSPSRRAVCLFSTVEDTPNPNVIYDYEHKRVRLMIKTPIYLNLLGSNIYFVYVCADISNAPEAVLAPCGCGNEIIMGTVTNTYTLYNTLMRSIREFDFDCNTKRNFIDDFLKVQSVETALKAGNYQLAIKYWKKFFLGKDAIIPNTNCNCNGRT